MARIVANKLTARRVQTEARKGYHLDGRGLYLQVTSGGGKSWVYRYTLRGVTRDMGLGSTAVLSLAEARESATEQRKLVAQGIDPIDARNARVELVEHTFDACAKEYIKANEAGWKNAKHVYQWNQTIETYASPFFGSLPVSSITIKHILSALEPIWTTKTETATRTRQRIEAILDYATVHKYRTGENPARWKGNLDKILPKPDKVAKSQHYPALPYENLPAFITSLKDREGLVPYALQFTILTCCRTGEVRRARALR